MTTSQAAKPLGSPILRTQAERIIARLGGPYTLAKLAGFRPSTVYRWTYESPRGTGGIIPARALERVLQVAHALGVPLTNKDLDPRPTEGKA